LGGASLALRLAAGTVSHLRAWLPNRTVASPFLYLAH
jgi:hypothetical protein